MITSKSAMVPRILLVDDQESDLASMRWAAEGFGDRKPEVVEARNSSDAIKLIKHEPFDVIITDLRMNGIETDGMKVLAEAPEDIPVIVVTTFASLGRSQKAIDEGAYDFLDRNASGVDALLMLRHKIKQAWEYRKAILARTAEVAHAVDR